MTDEELLGYASLHCQTERALFSRYHVVRIMKLAGKKVTESSIPIWVAVRPDVMDPLVKEARARIRRSKLKLVP